MAKRPEFPFDFDMTKYLRDFKMPDFDPAAFKFPDFQFGDVPQVDMDALMEAQRKNVEALTKANRMAFESVQVMMQRQADIMAQALDDMTQAIGKLSAGGDPQSHIADQAQLSTQAFEKSLANLKEMTDMMAKSNAEVFDVLHGRVSQMMDEFHGLLEKAAAAGVTTGTAAKKPAPSKSAPKTAPVKKTAAKAPVAKRAPARKGPVKKAAAKPTPAGPAKPGPARPAAAKPATPTGAPPASSASAPSAPVAPKPPEPPKTGNS